jgi:hypothetical protein
MSRSYEVEDYNQILFNGIHTSLPEMVLATIAKLLVETNEYASTISNSSTTSSTSYLNDTKFKKHGSNNTSNHSKKSRSNITQKNGMNEDWNMGKSFKATVIEKKEGTEKILNDIRATLNKLSNKNYDAQCSILIDYIHSLAEDEVAIKKVAFFIIEIAGTTIIEIAGTNIVLSDIFSKLHKTIGMHSELYKTLRSIFPIFDTAYTECMEDYVKSISEIHYVDPDEDYDKFCQYTKINNRRRALTTFFVHLMRNEVIEKRVIVNMVLRMQDLVFNYIEQENKGKEVEEITENIYLFVILSHVSMTEEVQWNTVLDNIKSMSKMKSKEKKSLSSRAVFKYMDITDTLKNMSA